MRNFMGEIFETLAFAYRKENSKVKTYFFDNLKFYIFCSKHRGHESSLCFYTLYFRIFFMKMPHTGFKGGIFYGYLY